MPEQASAPRFLPAGESCVVVDFGEYIDYNVNRKVQALRKALEKAAFPSIRELLPTYRSLAIYLNPLKENPRNLRKKIEEILSSMEKENLPPGEAVDIPVCYGEDFGPDLGFVASSNGLSEEEVLRRHSGREYYCYMLGFTPGFPYLGGMDPSIATPRLSKPRQTIPGGSVGIADQQTGIYPIESPGGWQLIGRTPLTLFDPRKNPPILLEAGLWIRFVPVSSEEYRDIARQVASGEYVLSRRERREP